ncbi:MAG: N-acetylmuramoyl-L-alanine amidase [Smithellaceae bacterium]|nr:N-acetylmuramoyl-L-alanine amidase [Smithellaceae bacterium]
MKKVYWQIWAILLIMGFLLPAGAIAEKKPPAKFRVLIDPAHGGSDTGVKAGGKAEKDLVLSLALSLKTELMKSPDIDVLLTRSSDKNMTNEGRANIALKMNPNVFISLHINAGFGKNASGYEVYFPGFKNAVAENADPKAIIADMSKNRYLNDAVRFSRSLQKNLDQVFPRKWRDLRDGPVLLLEGLNFPALVLELGFATNPEDQKKLVNEKTHSAIVQAIAKSIREFR